MNNLFFNHNSSLPFTCTCFIFEILNANISLSVSVVHMRYRPNSLSWTTRFFRHDLHELTHDNFSSLYSFNFNEQIDWESTMFQTLFFFFNFIFKLYIIVLVLPNIKMNPPQVYMCSPSWTLLSPPSSLPIPSLWVVPVHQPQASSIVHRTWTGNSFHTWYFTCFNAILPILPTLSLSHRVHKTVLYISVSFAVSYTGLLLPSF